MEDWINYEFREYLAMNDLTVPEKEEIKLHEIKDRRRT